MAIVCRRGKAAYLASLAVVAAAATASNCVCAAFQPAASTSTSTFTLTHRHPSSSAHHQHGNTRITITNGNANTNTNTNSNINTNGVSTTTSTATALYGKVWDKLGIDEDPPGSHYWYMLNCIAGSELELLAQLQKIQPDLNPDDCLKFVVPQQRQLRSHGQKNVVDVKALYP